MTLKNFIFHAKQKKGKTISFNLSQDSSFVKFTPGTYSLRIKSEKKCTIIYKEIPVSQGKITYLEIPLVDKSIRKNQLKSTIVNQKANGKIVVNSTIEKKYGQKKAESLNSAFSH